MGLIAAAVLVVAGAIIVIGRPASPPPTVAAVPSPGAAGDAQLIRPDSPTLGPADAPVTLVEFLDPECEACRAWYPLVKQLLAENPDSLRLVVRYVPGHGNSALAVVALNAAAEQGKYWEMLEALFAAQPEWGERQEPQVAAFTDIAESIGLDRAQFAAALARMDLSIVERDVADLQAFGVRGTPTFFVNGVQVTEQSEEGLRSAISNALAEG